MPDFISIDRRHQKLADNGDVDAVWQLLTTSTPGQIDYSEGFQLLLRAVEVRAGQAPSAFADELFKRILSFSGYLLLRSHLQLGWYKRSARPTNRALPCGFSASWKQSAKKHCSFCSTTLAGSCAMSKTNT